MAALLSQKMTVASISPVSLNSVVEPKVCRKIRHPVEWKQWKHLFTVVTLCEKYSFKARLGLISTLLYPTFPYSRSGGSRLSLHLVRSSWWSNGRDEIRQSYRQFDLFGSPSPTRRNKLVSDHYSTNGLKKGPNCHTYFCCKVAHIDWDDAFRPHWTSL